MLLDTYIGHCFVHVSNIIAFLAAQTVRLHMYGNRTTDVYYVIIFRCVNFRMLFSQFTAFKSLLKFGTFYNDT